MEELAQLEQRWQRRLARGKILRWTQPLLYAFMVVALRIYSHAQGYSLQWFHWLAVGINSVILGWDLLTGERRAIQLRDAEIARWTKHRQLTEELDGRLTVAGRPGLSG